MSDTRREGISRQEEEALRTLESHGGMRIENLAEELGIGYSEAKSTLHDLSAQGLVVTNPGLVYEADRNETCPPGEV